MPAHGSSRPVRGRQFISNSLVRNCPATGEKMGRDAVGRRALSGHTKGRLLIPSPLSPPLRGSGAHSLLGGQNPHAENGSW